MEPVACLDKCRVTFYWVIKYTIWPLAYLVPPQWERGRDRLLGVHIEHIRKHRRWKPLLKALPMKMAWKGQITSEGLEKDKVIIECPREHPKDTSGHVTSRGSPTGDVWWRHFRSKDSLVRRNPYFRLRIRAPHPPKGIPWGHVTFDDVTSGEKSPLGCILCNFRLRMCTPHPPKGTPSWWHDVWWRHFRWKDSNRADIVQFPVAHAHTSPKGTAFGVT